MAIGLAGVTRNMLKESQDRWNDILNPRKNGSGVRGANKLSRQK